MDYKIKYCGTHIVGNIGSVLRITVELNIYLFIICLRCSSLWTSVEWEEGLLLGSRMEISILWGIHTTVGG